MRKPHRLLRSWISLLVVVSMFLQVSPTLVPIVAAQSPAADAPAEGETPSEGESAPQDEKQPVKLHILDTKESVDASATYRTTVFISGPYDHVRLARIGVTVLQETEDSATVLVTEEQLEDLARLGFQPGKTDVLTSLLKMGGPRLSTEVSLAQLTLSSSVDDDADGLTNTQESWWGTDPMNPDSDGDGASDGDEVAALKAWLGNETGAPPATGKPFLSWPDMAADSDYDSVPDLAERWELGLNMNRESTDRDKFDDGQELFGITRWDWGALPRAEDTGYIFAEMPAWVKTPGDHPLVAAFPVPEIDVVESSLHVEAVTTVTTDHTIGEGTERSYSTAKMEGTSTGTEDTITWNEWQEISHTTPDSGPTVVQLDPQFGPIAALSSRTLFGLKIAGSTLGLMGAIGGAACIATAGVGCAILAAAGAVGAGTALAADLVERMDEAQDWAKANRCDPDAPYLLPKCVQEFLPSNEPQPILDNQANTATNQDVARGGSGTQYTTGGPNEARARTVVEVSYPGLVAVPTTTRTAGKSVGGARSTTHTTYEEHTITNGEAFSSSESWGTATAVDSSHAADLWFTYKVRNTGHEYAREIADLAFNIYLGDDSNPAYTYFVAPDLGGDGKFHNFMPDEEHTYTARRIALTLEQMMRIDLGGPVRIVVEDFTYGNDELFYQDAANAGVLVAMEDGTGDGDEDIDTYLIPTWGEETVLDVLARYFPHSTDAEGNIIAIWTPEYRAGTPSWCNEGYRTGSTLWCKHALSTADWWNIYTDGMGDGSEGFQDTPAAAGSVALFRFNKDSDLYNIPQKLDHMLSEKYRV